jgi:hypothetical protein
MRSAQHAQRATLTLGFLDVIAARVTALFAPGE